MVKLISFMALSTLAIAPTFAAVLPNIESRDVAEPHFFGRDMGGLFAREHDFELPDLARRFWSGVEDNRLLARRDVPDEMSPTPAQLKPHLPFDKHELKDEDERDQDRELFIRDVIDDDLFERFFDDLD